jgi:hypothetical protein
LQTKLNSKWIAPFRFGYLFAKDSDGGDGAKGASLVDVWRIIAPAEGKTSEN